MVSKCHVPAVHLFYFTMYNSLSACLNKWQTRRSFSRRPTVRFPASAGGGSMFSEAQIEQVWTCLGGESLFGEVQVEQVTCWNYGKGRILVFLDWRKLVIIHANYPPLIWQKLETVVKKSYLWSYRSYFVTRNFGISKEWLPPRSIKLTTIIAFSCKFLICPQVW